VTEDTSAAFPDQALRDFTRRGLATGFRRMLPLTAGNLAYGLVFGALAARQGFSLGETSVMSGVVYSGAAQVAALELWRTPPPMGAIWLTSALISLRYLVLGATLRPWLGRLASWRVYGSLLLLADQSWALALTEFRARRQDAGFLLGAGLALLVTWISGSAAGWLAGGRLPDPSRWALDFAPTAIFIALLPGLWRGRGDLLPWLVAAGVAIMIAQALSGPWYILLGAAAGTAAAVLRGRDPHAS
jgi:4-azaleucine resistance transporter AzlC